MLDIDKTPQLDEAVWQAWVKKNQEQDKMRSARRFKVVSVAALFSFVGALLWRFTG